MLENEPPFWFQSLNKICAQNTFQCFDSKTSTKKCFKKIKLHNPVCEGEDRNQFQ